MESKKLDQIFKTIAYFSGPQQVCDHDRYSITQRIRQEYFKDKEIPRLAAERVQAFLDEFDEYLPPKDLEETIQKRKKWLEILIKIKCCQSPVQVGLYPAGNCVRPRLNACARWRRLRHNNRTFNSLTISPQNVHVVSAHWSRRSSAIQLNAVVRVSKKVAGV